MRHTAAYSLIALLLCLAGCEKKYEAPVPSLKWDLFESAKNPVPAAARNAMEGIYTLEAGSGLLGGEAALKWSYLAQNGDTTYYLSGFCELYASYFICEGRQLDSMLLFSGYWRKMINTETGSIRFTILPSGGSRMLLAPSFAASKGSVRIEGLAGTNNSLPGTSMVLRYNRPLHAGSSFEMLAHRCGGRTSDLLPVSENSVGMAKMASRLGATGVEMDVRLTSDFVPVVYHDERLNDRLVKPNGMQGPLSNYSYIQLYDLVRLIDGQRIPKLREILDAVLYNTALRIVWLDIKFYGSLQQIRDIQAEYEQKARAMNRDLKIMIGLPDPDVEKNFMYLPDYTMARSLDETFDGAERVGAYAWGARWTLGTQDAAVEKAHAEGRKAFAWTMDDSGFIKQYIQDGHFDGILSNYPCVVAYYYYAKQ